MRGYTKSMKRLINELVKMPSVGPKTAERIAFYILRLPKEEAKALSLAILKAKETIGYCRNCHNLTESEICQICQDQGRDKSIICVVETANDVTSIENAGNFKGVYHVLGGAISPLDGISPDKLQIQDLLSRIKNNSINEVIIATNYNMEGEATALYLVDMIRPLGVKITRIAQGIPAGSNIGYADQETLVKALEGRKEI